MLKREWGTKKNRDGTLSLMLYNGSDTELMVPSKIGDALITAIAPRPAAPTAMVFGGKQQQNAAGSALSILQKALSALAMRPLPAAKTCGR